MRRALTILLAAGATLLAACATNPGESESDGDDAAEGSSAVVEPERFEKVKTILESIDYLPFRYRADGCTARALYMSMELAAEGIESNAVFAYAARGTTLQVDDVSWGFHVAPLFLVGHDAAHARRVVIDPSVASKQLDERDWLRKMSVSVAPGDPAYPLVFIVPGSDFWPPNEANIARDSDVADFASLPPFGSDDILEACNVAFKWIGLEEGLSDDQKTDKRNRLVSRSSTLVARIASRSKLASRLDGPLDRARLERECVGTPKHTEEYFVPSALR